MKLYHASPFVIKQPDVYHSREHLDFGKGFYLTSLYDQAYKYAMRFLLRIRHLHFISAKEITIGGTENASR